MLHSGVMGCLYFIYSVYYETLTSLKLFRLGRHCPSLDQPILRDSKGQRESIFLICKLTINSPTSSIQSLHPRGNILLPYSLQRPGTRQAARPDSSKSAWITQTSSLICFPALPCLCHGNLIKAPST
jgi:hypothetical protein